MNVKMETQTAARRPPLRHLGFTGFSTSSRSDRGIAAPALSTDLDPGSLSLRSSFRGLVQRLLLVALVHRRHRRATI